MNRLIERAAMLVLPGLLAMSATAQETADGRSQIEKAVRDFIAAYYAEHDAVATATTDSKAATFGRRVEIDVTRLDPRLDIRACHAPLQVSLQQNRPPLGRVTARVDCQGTAPWSRYIAANVKVYEQVLVSARPLTRGHVVTAADVQLQEMDVGTVRGSWLTGAALAIGKELRRSLPSGTAVTNEALAEQELVARGDTVVLTAQRGAVTIRQQGVALQAGESGSQISVRNSNSDRVVQAVVTGPGQAQVTF